MRHLRTLSNKRVPALADELGGGCLADFLNGDFAICCGYPSLFDCIKCDFGLGSCKGEA